MSDIVRETKARVKVADVLDRLGAQFYAESYAAWDDEVRFYCPFCEDLDSDKPAGRANDMKGVWHCFACNAGGDIFTAVQKARGVGFDEALQWVLDQFPVEVREVDPWADEQGAS